LTPWRDRKERDAIRMNAHLFYPRFLMKTQSIDTHPKAEAVQIALLRQASIAKRIAQMRSLTQTIMRLSQNAVARANPGLSDQELKVSFARYHYGDELANRLQAYFKQRVSEVIFLQNQGVE
jgi:hypothetical protein